MMKEPLAPATFFYTGIVGAQDFMDGKAKEISGYKVVDDYTVQITLEKPDGAFLMAMSMPFTSVMSKEWVRQGRQTDQTQAARHRPLRDHELDRRASPSAPRRTPTGPATPASGSTT